MKKNIEKEIELLNKNDAPDNAIYSALLKKIDFEIDKDFLEFIKMYDGAEGNIGNNNYISFWNTEQLITLNPYYEYNKDCEELFFFGTDGSNLGYAFEKKNGQIISIDFLDISQIQPDVIADTFELFLSELSNN
ncbi:SMI1/KNR4 family protein [Flavobacterium sp. CAU 1735]|uniref:SMI1/KNR4 family protein n=1 Tax=Flavobacterium sp. CAU 1735 TaxID=3140361 RepID=UPI003260026A